MPKKISDIALAKVPSFANRVSLFQSKLQITRPASGTIVDYSHALYKAVSHIGKLPEEFSQEDADGYLSYLLSRQPQPAVSQFKHFIYGLKSYLHAMGCPDLAGLAQPKIRREKRLPKVLSVEQVRQLLRSWILGRLPSSCAYVTVLMFQRPIPTFCRKFLISYGQFFVTASADSFPFDDASSWP